MPQVTRHPSLSQRRGRLAFSVSLTLSSPAVPAESFLRALGELKPRSQTQTPPAPASPRWVGGILSEPARTSVLHAIPCLSWAVGPEWAWPPALPLEEKVSFASISGARVLLDRMKPCSSLNGKATGAAEGGAPCPGGGGLGPSTLARWLRTGYAVLPRSKRGA